MTKINRITIHGFKSFANKVDIPFDNTFNCILGANGSGKSNVSDSICFVLGRLSAKSLRAEKASNLIFNGGKQKKPASNAYVEIAFCNKNKIFPHDEKEIIIRRKISKAGGSTYFINGKKSTRTEILDTLALAKINPMGYNIIVQGDVTRFVDMTPLERRRIIEQISDIAIYEEKKHKAILELNKVEEKLHNAMIILKERKVYLKELKKDRDQALKYKDIQDKIADFKGTYLHLQIQDNKYKNKEFIEKIETIQSKIKESESNIDNIKKDIEEKKKQINEINQEIEEKGEKEQLKVHRVIEELKVNLAKNKTRTSTLNDEINKIKQRKKQFNDELNELKNKCTNYINQQKELETEIKSKNKELSELDEKIKIFKKKHKIESSQEMDQEIENQDKLIEEKQEEVQLVRSEQQELLREKDKLEYQIQTIDERIKKVKEIEKEHKDQIKILQTQKKKFKEVTLKLNEHINKDSKFAAELSNARRKFIDLQEKHSKLNAKAMSAQAQAATNRAVASLTQNKKKFKGLHGTVAELGQVNKKYSKPLEVAAGTKLQHLIVEDDQVAQDCIKYLKNQKLGAATFIPLNKIRYQKINPEDKKLHTKSGVHDFAINLITFQSKYKPAFQYVFGNTLIVEDINTARKVGIGKIRMATMDGNSVEASGVMRGGFNQKRKSIGFQERDNLEELELVESEISKNQSIISNIESKRQQNEELISTLRKEKSELEGEIIKAEKTLHLNTSDLDANNDLKKELKENLVKVDNNLSDIQRKLSKINKELAMIKSKRQMIKTQITAARSPQVLAQISAFDETKQKLRENIVRFENDLRNSKQNMDQIIAPEREKIQEIMKQHDKEEEQFINEIKELNKIITIDEKDLKIKEQQSKEFYSKYKELFTKREKHTNHINSCESKIENIREKMRSNEQQMNLISLQNAEVKAKLTALEEEFEKYKDCKLIKDKSLKELQHEVAKFEVALAQMSAVNMKALEIYEQVEVEYNKLTEKKDNLDKEKIEVHTLMNEIETRKKENFMKTFNQANENFQRIFSNLFNKGQAYLELEDKENIFEGGMDIKVKLTGNRFMDIKSLSGGEKTLTALSFIFSIQEYQPASFYILDEIDAALDKHNAETLAKLIRNYSNKAQYIVISHNDAVISESDTLFGVSMSDGISKVTSLKI